MMVRCSFFRLSLIQNLLISVLVLKYSMREGILRKLIAIDTVQVKLLVRTHSFPYLFKEDDLRAIGTFWVIFAYISGMNASFLLTLFLD